MTLLSTYNKVALCCKPVWETLIATPSSEIDYTEHISTQNNIDVERVQKGIVRGMLGKAPSHTTI